MTPDTAPGITFQVVNAFTDEPFSGNPAAVGQLPGNRWPTAAWMRNVARDFNLSETAFLLRPSEVAPETWHLRWFTPEVEDDLCGHATLAAAHVLFEADPGTRRVTFVTRAGALHASRTGNGGIKLDFPAHQVTQVTVPGYVAEAFGRRPKRAFTTGALRDLILLFDSEAHLAGVDPDMPALAALGRQHDVRGFTCTAPSTRPGIDFVSRFFSPHDGIPEDPVTGSAHTALAPLWASLVGRTSLTARQISHRPGQIRLRLDGDRVHLEGPAFTALRGTVTTPPDYP